MIAHNAESARGTAPQAAHRSGLEPRDSSGSCHPMKTAVLHLDCIGSSCCPGNSRFPREVSTCVPGVFDRLGLRWTSRHRCSGWGLPRSPAASASRSDLFTRLNTRPAHSLVNASTTPSRAAPHDSGSMWVATSHSYDFSITPPRRFNRRTKER
jgi:hypothetical protein